ncbi:MAG: hypothetical protein L6V93_01405 [Clostridiales bacterium]|nr:MAG: hypothetical protein L6V93_01405 [Clostridiales bacterium]
MASRLNAHYENEVKKSAYGKKFGYKSPMEIPKLEKNRYKYRRRRS